VPRNAEECPACHIKFSTKWWFGHKGGHALHWKNGKPEFHCPKCGTSLKAHVPVCPECTQHFAMDGEQWKGMEVKYGAERRCPCAWGSSTVNVKMNASSCPKCGIDFKLKDGIWETGRPEPARLPLCPYCSYELEPNTGSCDRCGVLFERYLEQVNKPVIRKDFQIEYLDKILSACESKFEGMWSLSTERYLEVFEAIEHGAVHPVAFLRKIIDCPAKDDGSLEVYLPRGISEYGMSFEDYIFFISEFLAYLPDKPLLQSEAYKLTDRSLVEHSHRRYDSHLLDYCVGSGWLPPCDEYVQISFIEALVKSYTELDYYIKRNYSGLPERIPTEDVDICLYCLRKSPSPSLTSGSRLCCFSLALSDKEAITPAQMEHFWSSLQRLTHPVVLEIVGSGTAHTVVFQLLCRDDDKTHIANQLRALFPNSIINEQGNDTDALIEQVGEDFQETFSDEYEAHGVWFG